MQGLGRGERHHGYEDYLQQQRFRGLGEFDGTKDDTCSGILILSGRFAYFKIVNSATVLASLCQSSSKVQWVNNRFEPSFPFQMVYLSAMNVFGGIRDLPK